MDPILELERLELVAKVTSELDNHLGTSDKTLAEFIIDQHKNAKSFDDFQKFFQSEGLPDSLIQSIDRVVNALNPGSKPTNGTNGATKSAVKGKRDVFKGLALPDSAPDSTMDDLMAELESSAPKAQQPKRRERDDRYYEGRRNNRHRERSPREDRDSARGRDRDRHRSPDYDRRRHTRRNDYEEPIPAHMPAVPPAPITNGIYNRNRTERKRLTSPERFEIQQLISSGVAKPSDFPGYEFDFEASSRTTGGLMEHEEDPDIEVKDEEPPFLKGQTQHTQDLSPVRIIKAPEGSLNRAAQQGVQLATERREIRSQEAREKGTEALSNRDIQSGWNDPMARAQDRQFAGDVRDKALPPSAGMPEWKRRQANQSYGKRTNMSIKEQRESLPAFRLRKTFLQAMEENQVLVIQGETGSGKTTQLPQFLAEAGYGNKGMIGCTQPRRVAAISVAKRVAEEVGCKLGHEVGYTIRFEDNTSPDTTIKFMTDGILLRESVLDPKLEKYSVIILDEAHERTVATDVLFGLLKRTLRLRPELKVIVTSATLEAEKFQAYFGEFGKVDNMAPHIRIPGRTFNVEIFYSNEPESDYLDAALTTVMQIHITEEPGDILVFLTGKEEIDSTCQVLFERMKQLGPEVPELVILPIYSALPSEMQSQVFEPAPLGGRKVIVATNIAETSLTVDGIVYVIDPGFVKQSVYDPKLGMDRLLVQPISQQQAGQRAGRAGRTADGKCFRLYTEHAFLDEMQPATIPEIQRQNLASTILSLKARGINDLLNFGFLDPPPEKTMLSALEELYHLDALDDEGLLTRLGRAMVDFPMDPALAKTCISSARDFRCSDEVLTIVSCISSGLEFFSRPRAEQNKADQKKAKFHDATGDHITLLNAFESWQRNGESFAWCKENYIQFRSMKRAKDVREQLVGIMQRHRLALVNSNRDTHRIRKALVAGLFKNTARKDPHEGYKTLTEQQPVALHPSSALFGKTADFVVYHSLVETVKEYMHCCSTIDPKWLPELAPNFFKVADPAQLSRRQKAAKITPLAGKGADDDSWRLSSQRRQGKGGGGGTWG